MAVTLFRLLTLVALVLMPFTMASAPAEAHHDQTIAAMSADHCADQDQDSPAPAGDMTQCMLMCAALPAGDSLRVVSPGLPRVPLLLAPIRPIQGIILELATPPPRRS